MKKHITALFTAALILANFTACNSDTEPIENLSNNSSGISNISEENSSEAASEPETSKVPQVSDEEPTFLKGPAGDPIYPSDITYAIISGSNSHMTDISQLTKSNFSLVQCDDFGYLREPTGIRYNCYESPEKFESKFPYLYTGGELVNQNPIKRVYVGEEICGMTVAKIGTSFVNRRGGASVPFWNDSFAITFKGEITLTGYLSVEDMTPDYPGTEGMVTFWLDEQSDPLPITDISVGENGAESHYCRGAGFYAENGVIDLGSIYNGRIPATCDETLLDGITYGDQNVHVKITIDDYIALGQGDSRAVLKSLEKL